MAIHERLFFLLLALLPTQLGFHFWPSWSVVLGRRIDYLSPTIFLTDIIIILIMLFWRMPKKNIYYIFPILAFAVVNIWFSISKPVALYTWIKIFEFTFLGYYIYIIKPKTNSALFFLSIGVLYSSIIGIAQFSLQQSLGGLFWFLGERTFTIDTPGIARFNFCSLFTVNCELLLRPYATFPHPNVLGGYIALLIPFLFQKIRSRYYAIVFLFALTTLVISFSRTAWLVAIVGMILMSWKSYSKYFIIVGLLGLFLFFRPHVGDESIVERMQLNQSAIALWQQSPLIGIGLGNFVTQHFQPVHNIYLLVLSEVGLIGVVISLFLLSRLSYGILLIPMVILGLFDHYLLTLQQGQLLFTIFLVQLAHARQNSD